MSLHVVILSTGLGLAAAVLEDGRLVELREAETGVPGQVTDDLFLARVTAVEPKLNAAFLDCGLERPGFITAKDARAAGGDSHRAPIRELLREGQSLLVQGLREAVDDKGPRFTADIRLFGLALVHAPRTAGVEVSGGLSRRAGELLRERATTLFPDGGFVLRRHAAETSDAALKGEAEALAGQWRRVQAEARGQARPGRIEAGESLLGRLVRRVAELRPTLVEVTDMGLWRELEALRDASPAWPEELELRRLEGEDSTFAAREVEAQIDEALARDVALTGGGRIRIEPTAALTAIDVDGGGRDPLDANLAAIPEIARQLRLRNIGGTVVVDFVDLERAADRKRLEEGLRKVLRADPLPVELHTGAALGLMILSRARRGDTLAQRRQRVCACCGGLGEVPALAAQAGRLLATLRERPRPPAAVRVAADLDRFLQSARAGSWRGAVGALLLRPWQADPALSPGEFQLDG